MSGDLPRIDSINWDDIANDISSASSMLLGQTRTWQREYDVDTHLNSAKSLGALFCYNCCGVVTHLHEKTFKVTKEEASEYEKKSIDKLGAEVGASLGIDKVAGVSAKGSVTTTTSISEKVEKKTILETEEKVSFEGHARSCRKIFMPIGLISRLDIKGKVIFRRTYHVDLQGGITWTGIKEVDTTKLELTLSQHIGPYDIREEANDCGPCKDGHDTIIEKTPEGEQGIIQIDIKTGGKIEAHMVTPGSGKESAGKESEKKLPKERQEK